MVWERLAVHSVTELAAPSQETRVEHYFSTRVMVVPYQRQSEKIVNYMSTNANNSHAPMKVEHTTKPDPSGQHAAKAGYLYLILGRVEEERNLPRQFPLFAQAPSRFFL